MPGKYGSASIFILVDGYNLVANKLKGWQHKVTSALEKTDGLGDSWEEHTPTGMKTAEISQNGALFDTADGRIHEAMAASVPGSPQATPRIACFGYAGMLADALFVGVQGEFTEAYDVLAQLGQLIKANVTHRITGKLEWGRVLYPLQTQTQDFIGDWVDNGSATTAGATGYQQLTDGFGGFTGRIEHSADGVASETLLTFTAASAPSAERKEVSGTIKRYTRYCGVVFSDISPSASVSPSSSLSPSVSASISASASTSPSGSTSPSSSLSPSSSFSPTRSASASISPSSSISPSLSASLSASSSRSPSSSLSPSVSSSASVSPSSGLAGDITAFCGLVRN